MSKKITVFGGIPKTTDPKTIKKNKIWSIINYNYDRGMQTTINNILYKKICAEVFDNETVSKNELLNLIKNEYKQYIETVIGELNKMIIEDIIK